MCNWIWFSFFLRIGYSNRHMLLTSIRFSILHIPYGHSHMKINIVFLERMAGWCIFQTWLLTLVHVRAMTVSLITTENLVQQFLFLKQQVPQWCWQLSRPWLFPMKVRMRYQNTWKEAGNNSPYIHVSFRPMYLCRITLILYLMFWWCFISKRSGNFAKIHQSPDLVRIVLVSFSINQ